MLIRRYTPYQTWECYLNGMWDNRLHKSKEVLDFMMDLNKFSHHMEECCLKWHSSTLNFLTNTSINRIAHIGQMACCHAIGATSLETKQAWKQLTNENRQSANIKAALHLKHWEQRYKSGKLLGYPDATARVFLTSVQMKLDI